MLRVLILLGFFICSNFAFSQKGDRSHISIFTSFILNKQPSDSDAVCEIRIWELKYGEAGLGLDVPIIYKEFSEKCVIKLYPGEYAVEYRTGDKLLHMENVSILADEEPITFQKYILWRPIPFSEFDFKILTNIKVRDIIYMEF